MQTSFTQFSDFNMYRVVNICRDRSGKRRNGRHLKKRRGRITDEVLNDFRDDVLRLSNASHDLSLVEGKILSTRRRVLERFVSSQQFSELSGKIQYLIKSRVNFSRKVKPGKREREVVSWGVQFAHKIMSDVNLNSIINHTGVKFHLPRGLRDKMDIHIVYKFGKTIGSKILNYNRILKQTGRLSYADIQNMRCSCEDSPFKNDRFGHVITGDLNIIQNRSLREICGFGTKFRENPFFSVNRLRDQVKKDINDLATKISSKFKISKASLKIWKTVLFKNFLTKLFSCIKNKSYKQPVLSNNLCKQELSRLQDCFVITVVDKASGNFAFTCKKFYFLCLAKELGLDNLTPGNETYEFVNHSEEQIVQKIKSDLVNFRISPSEGEEKLALLYQTPKFHKNPPKMRYIAGNVSTVTSKLDFLVANVLKMCKNHFKNLCIKAQNFSGVRYFFDVQTSSEVKGMFEEIQGSALSISINDFSTLYTLFDHDHLLSNMNWLLSKLSRNSGMSYIRVGHEQAWWVANDSEGLVYGMGELIDMIEYLIRNTHIKAFGHIFRQNKGIIMGGKSSGWLSDCSLMVDEYRYIDNKIKSGLAEDAHRLKFSGDIEMILHQLMLIISKMLQGIFILRVWI